MFTDACTTKSKKQVSFKIYAGIFQPVAYRFEKEKEPDICLSLHEILEKQLHHRCIFDFLFSPLNPFSWLLLTGIYIAIWNWFKPRHTMPQIYCYYYYYNFIKKRATLLVRKKDRINFFDVLRSKFKLHASKILWQGDFLKFL